jgi:hypothetical protein
MALWVLGVGLVACERELPAPEPVVEAPAPAVEAAPVAVAPEPPPEPPAPPPPPPPPPRPKDPYLALRYDIEQERLALAHRREQGELVLADAQAELQKRLPELIDKWKGTRWSYSGTTETPKQGKIACGYFVSTVLQHAGFRVDRVDLARQPSEQILRTVIPEQEIERFSWANRDKVTSRIEALGPGVYLVGLDTHIGFLVNGAPKAGVKGKVQFCHSTSRNHKTGVICENPRTSPSFKSDLTVIGRIGLPPLIDAWLTDSVLPTARKGLTPPLALLDIPHPPLIMGPPVPEGFAGPAGGLGTDDGVAGTL